MSELLIWSYKHESALQLQELDRTKEREAKRVLEREAHLSPMFLLLDEAHKGVFEDKFLHFMLIGKQWPPTGDFMLNIAFFPFIGIMVEGKFGHIRTEN